MSAFTEWQNTLLLWYSQHQRDLPWRRTADPYRIWVSEIILQQTRVVQGLDYYHRFLEAFPSVERLAEASEDDVLKVWQGLGYYSRARNMHAAAKQIVALGHFPDTYKDVRALKGVGDYTAAAICSFAYGLPHAVVDGNVYRVLSRYYGLSTPIDSSKGKKDFADLAQMLLPHDRAALYNQALMDFGAMQCVPKSPDCPACPLSGACVAYAEGKVEDYPVKTHRVKVAERHFVYLYIESPQGIWLHRREPGDIWQGLYEFPLLEFDTEPTLHDILQHEWMQQHFPSKVHLNPLLLHVKHVLTHRYICASCYVLRMDEPCRKALPDGFIAVDREQMDEYAVPKLVQMFKDKLGEMSKGKIEP